MRSTTNTKLINQRSTIARYSLLAGLAILVGSLVASFVANEIALAYASLFVGFILAYVGSTMTNKWVREPRADVALEKALKGFDNKNHLYNYLLPAEHVLLTPTGLLILKIKSNDGNIICNGEKWKRPWAFSRLFGGMGQEPLGNPAVDLRLDIQKMKDFLADKLENPALAPIDGYVVFSDPKAQLSLEEPTVPVVRIEDLKDALRKAKRGPVLSPKLQEDLGKILDEAADAKTAK